MGAPSASAIETSGRLIIPLTLFMWSSAPSRITADSAGSYGLGADRNECLFEDVETAIQFLLADHQREQQADDIVVKASFEDGEAVRVAVAQDVVGHCSGGFAGRTVSHQLHRDHGAASAHVTDVRKTIHPNAHARPGAVPPP